MKTTSDKRESLDRLGHILNYVSKQWYETEYGQSDSRWYKDAMYRLEDLYSDIAQGVIQ